MDVVKVQYAKTHLSALLAAVERGEQFVISRGDQAVARLVPMGERPKRDLGFLRLEVANSFFDDLPEEELAAWETGR